MSRASRYRLEGDLRTIDVRVHRVEQLFDNRDPAPFRDRDLDPDLTDYLLEASEDLLDEPRLRVVFWIDEPARADEVEQAFRTQFADLIHRLRRRRAQSTRTAQAGLVLALGLLVVLLSLAYVVNVSVQGWAGMILRESLILSCWIILWRPIETLLYDWIPVRRERKIASRLLDADLAVRVATAAPPPKP